MNSQFSFIYYHFKKEVNGIYLIAMEGRINMYDVIVVGAGYAGCIAARLFAEKKDYKVLILEKKDHIGGTIYDYINDDGILVHKYGPHISVMKEKRAYDFLSQYTEWIPYHHYVHAIIDGIEVPLPINFTSIDLLFPLEKAINLKSLLIESYGFGSNVTVLEMLNNTQKDIHDFAEYVFEKVFLHYTMKMWGLTPDQIDPSVTARIPIRLSYDDRHFQHPYQVMPKNGFTSLIKNMIDHKNIDVQLSQNACDRLSFDESSATILFDNQPFKGKIVYTGAIDELFGYQFGTLPYRSLKFEHLTYDKDYIQDSAVQNWPDDRPATRRTEMKRLTQQKMDGKTSVIIEYPGAYKIGDCDFGEPLYPIVQQECIAIHEKYLQKAKQYNNLILIGRLADYRYYNMEATVLRSLDVINNIIDNQ